MRRMHTTGALAAVGLAAALGALGAFVACARSPRATQDTPVASVQQQGGEVRGRRPDPLRNITLSDAQRAQVDSIRARYRAQLEEFRGSQSADRRDPDTRRRFREIMDKQFADIRAVLTPEQQAVFDQNLQEMRSRRRGNQ
jgi:Spy/CpxP family protein refolding chaperone